MQIWPAGSWVATARSALADFWRRGLKRSPVGVDSVAVAAELGERRAARLRAAAKQDPAGGQERLAAARRIEQGNDGERRVAELLDVLDGARWVMLHDRYKSRASPANLDHVAVGPPGVFVIDSKSWTGGRLRYDDRGMAIGRYRRDDELHSAKVDADIVRRAAVLAVPDVPVVGVLAFVEDVALTAPVHHQQVMLLQAEQLLGWLTGQPAQLTPAQVHQVSSTLDAALPPRDGPRHTLNHPAGSSVGLGSAASASRATAPHQTSPTRRPASGGGGGGRRRRPARTAGQELADGLRRLVALAALAALIVFVAVPLGNRVLPSLLTHLFQASVTRIAPAPSPATPGSTAPAGTCSPARPAGTPGCAAP